MSWLSHLKSSHVTLVGDGCLLTAGVFAVFSAVSLAMDSASGLIGIAGVFIGPLVTWLLYKRRVDVPATLGALVGYPLGSMVVYAGTMSAALLTLVVGMVTRSAYAGAVTFLLVIVAGFLALIVWLVDDAVRDLGRSSPAHARLDIARLLATVAVLAFTTSVIAVTAAQSTADPEAVVFVLAAGVVGGVVVEAADLGTRFTHRHSHTHTVAGA